MKSILFFVCIFFSAVANGQVIDSLDARNGFRDMYFGNMYDLQNMPEFLPAKTPDRMTLIPGTTTVRYRQDDQLQFGAVKAERIYYMFKDSILLGYAIDFSGSEAAAYIANALTQLYGPATSTLDDVAAVQPVQAWTGKTNECVLRVIKDGNKRRTIVSYTNTPSEATVKSELFPKQHDGF